MRPPRDDDDRGPLDSGPDGWSRAGWFEPGWWEGGADPLQFVVIPDDISELDDEVRAYRRELRAAQRRERWGRFLPAGPLRRYGLSGPLIAVVLLLVAVTGVLMTVFAPDPGRKVTQYSVPMPLASPSVPVGSVGGLLPDVALTAPDGQLPARDLRPAVIVLLPHGCACVDALRQVMQQALETPPQLSTVLVSAGSDPAALGLSRDMARGLAPPILLRDPDGILEHTYRTPAVASDSHTPLLLLVAGDGRLLRPALPFHKGDRIEGVLDTLRG